MKIRGVAVAIAAVTGVAMTITGTGAVASVPPAAGSRASAIDSVTTPIKHVVVIYQENHTFDETLGALCQTRTTPCDGYVGPVTLKGGTVVSMTQSQDIVPNVMHSVAAQKAAIDGGKMDGWAGVKGCDATHSYGCLTYYTPNQIPNLAQLANTYAVSDRTFSMANSPSWGGHLYAAAASTGGFTGDNPKPVTGVAVGGGWGCDSNETSLWRNPTTKSYSQQPSCIPDPALDPTTHPYGGAFRATPVSRIDTIFDRLDAAQLSWKIYGQPKPVAVNGTYSIYRDGYIWSICPSFAECMYTRQVNNLVPTANVLTDAANGTLPAYSVLTPSVSSQTASGNMKTGQHNNDSMLAGDNWIGSVVSAIQRGPNGLNTAIFITYDDCGCFYDHVPPPTNPDGTREGPRMPMVIVSPYTKPTYTDSTPASFASILAFTEHTFGLSALSRNDANAYDYSGSFDYTQTPIKPARLSQHTVSPATVTHLQDYPSDEEDVT